jgi:hypothetical protein
VQAELRVAEGLAQHDLQLLLRRARQRLLDEPLQCARGEQLGGDQREQESVPDRRASGHEHPDHDAVQLRVFGAHDVRQLEQDLA